MSQLVGWAVGLISRVDGITLSGGEPFAQAEVLTEFCQAMRRYDPELSLMSYSGYRREWLERQGSTAQRELLDEIDVLVDGPYVDRWHASLRWRGSTNQRIHLLTDRHSPDELLPDVSVGIELEVRPDASIGFVGVPPEPGFRDAITASLADAGLVLTAAEASANEASG